MSHPRLTASVDVEAGTAGRKDGDTIMSTTPNRLRKARYGAAAAAAAFATCAIITALPGTSHAAAYQTGSSGHNARVAEYLLHH